MSPQAYSVSVQLCGGCGASNGIAARFCGTCGTRLVVHCWGCGTGAPVGQAFCAACGTPLVQLADIQRTPAASEPLRVSGPALAAGPSVTTPPETADTPAGRNGATAASPGAPAPAFMTQSSLAARIVTAVDGVPSRGGSAAGSGGLAALSSSMDAPPAGDLMALAHDENEEDDSDARLVEERRIVSVLFADIVGFTTISERLDPEDVRELSASVLARLAEAVSLYGGTIDKFIGDAVMGLFGAPIAHEDDPVRAVHAALAMHQAVAALNPTDRDGNDLNLRLRIGINSGEVIAGVRDVGGHREYTVFGDVVNTAARLQAAVAPGGILLGEETARQAGSVFDVAAVEPLVLKGKAKPVPAYEVRGGVTRGSQALDSLTGGRKQPLVGRLLEVRELRGELIELARGRGHLRAIIGEHGIGKSRLLAEGRDHAEELGLRWVEAGAPSHAQGLSYRLIREIVTRLLDMRPGSSDERLVEALTERLGRLNLDALVPPLALVLGAESDAESTLGLTAQQLQWRVVAAMRGLLTALAAERPLVLVLDALQWADPSSIEILLELMELSDAAPIVFIYVFTPEPDAPSWQLKEQAARAFPHRYAEMLLGPLPEQAARELMCSLLSCAETPGLVEDLVLERTDGNPFFIEEVLRALIDSGALRFDGERWVADSDIRELEIPHTLLATVMARIDRLPAGVRRTLQIAAVIGREVSERVLRRVVDGGVELDRQLREALRAGLLREEAVIPERRYAFTQALIHEGAARSLLVRRRREIHVQVGWALEEIYADNLEGQYGELTRHFWEGESWELAFRYSRLAAEQAAAAYANDEAEAAFTIAIESAGRSAAGAAPPVVAMLSERRGDVRALAGEYESALGDYKMAIGHYLAERNEHEDEPVSRDESTTVGLLALKIARLYSYQGQVDMMHSNLELAFKLLPSDSPDLSSAWSLKAAGSIWATDSAAAVEAGRRALKIARARGTFQHLSEAYESLTHASLISALGREIGELADEWVRLARERPEERPLLFKALMARGLVHVWAYWTFSDEIRADMLEALDIAQMTGSTPAENTARGILGIGHMLAGDWEQAELELRRSAGQVSTLVGVGAIYEWWLMLLETLLGNLEPAAAQMAIWLDDPNNTHRNVLMRTLLAYNRLLAGDDAAARAGIEEAAHVSATLGCGQCDLTMHMFAVELYATLGDAAPALEHAALARGGGEQHGRRAAILAADRAEAIVALDAGRTDDAVKQLERVQADAEALGQPLELARSLLLLAEAYEAADDGTAATLQRERARGLLAGLGVPESLPLVRTRSARRLPV